MHPRDLALGMQIMGATQFLTTHAPALSVNVGGNPLTTRATTWGAGSTGIATTFNATWVDAAHVTEFFKALGQIRIRLTHPNVTGLQNLDWNAALGTRLATVTFNNVTTTNNGSTNYAIAQGWASLTGTPVFIINANPIGGTSYTANTAQITAATITNGVQFVATLFDAHTGTSDVVAAGTTLAVDVLFSVGSIATVVPTISLISGF